VPRTPAPPPPIHSRPGFWMAEEADWRMPLAAELHVRRRKAGTAEEVEEEKELMRNQNDEVESKYQKSLTL
jgi:hypothetical protein